MSGAAAKLVDADTHVSENEQMWEHFEREMYHRRPVLISVPENTLYGDRNAMWLIDGNIFPKPAGKGGFALITPSAAKKQQIRTDISAGCREITDPEARLHDMDKSGFDVQVIYPTLFLIYLTDDVALEVALCRAYNRWMAEACAKGKDRLKWVVIPPLHSMEESIKELRWAKEHGAVGVSFAASRVLERWMIRTFSRSIKKRVNSICRSAFIKAPVARR
jgi:predicted TIM-barrel fold metal-dependent hydrolase